MQYIIQFYFMFNCFMAGAFFKEHFNEESRFKSILTLISITLFGIFMILYGFIEEFFDDIMLLDWLKVFFTNTYENLNERACIQLGDACQRKGIKTLHGKSFNLLCRFINYKYNYRIKHL